MKHLLERGTVSEPDLHKLVVFRERAEGAADESPDELLLRVLRAFEYHHQDAWKVPSSLPVLVKFPTRDFELSRGSKP